MRNILLCVLFFAFPIVAGPQELVRDALQKLQNLGKLKENGIEASFVLKTDADQNFSNLEVKLESRPGIIIGRVDVMLLASWGASYQAGLMEKQVGLFGRRASNRAKGKELDAQVKKFKATIGEDNYTYYQTVNIDKGFRGKGFSYPMICTTAFIIRNIFEKEYVLLLDLAERPEYYENVGFKAVVEGEVGMDFKYAALSDIMSSGRCQNILIEMQLENGF